MKGVKNIHIPSYSRDIDKLKKLIDKCEELSYEVRLYIIHCNYEDGIGNISWKHNEVLKILKDKGEGFYRVDLDAWKYVTDEMFELEKSPYNITGAFNDNEGFKKVYYKKCENHDNTGFPVKAFAGNKPRRYFEVDAFHSPIRYIDEECVKKYPELKFGNVYDGKTYSQSDNITYQLTAVDMGLKVGIDKEFQVIHPLKSKRRRR